MKNQIIYRQFLLDNNGNVYEGIETPYRKTLKKCLSTLTRMWFKRGIKLYKTDLQIIANGETKVIFKNNR